jgi:HAD superfamily hydrolase (TIGR01509 family)
MLRPLDPLTAVLFDVDGTLIDSNGAHAETWAQALTEHGLPRSPADVRPLIGMGSDKLLPAVASLDEDSPKGRAVSKRRSQLFRERLPRLHPTRGARALVESLKDQRKSIVIATSASEEDMDALLQQAGVADLLPHRTSSDDAERSKPDADIVLAALRRAGSRPEATVMIGDTPYDVEAAARAGIDTIALLSGGHWSRDDLAGAIAVFDDPADLCAAWQRGAQDFK